MGFEIILYEILAFAMEAGLYYLWTDCMAEPLAKKGRQTITYIICGIIAGFLMLYISFSTKYIFFFNMIPLLLTIFSFMKNFFFYKIRLLRNILLNGAALLQSLLFRIMLPENLKLLRITDYGYYTGWQTDFLLLSQKYFLFEACAIIIFYMVFRGHQTKEYKLLPEESGLIGIESALEFFLVLIYFKQLFVNSSGRYDAFDFGYLSVEQAILSEGLVITGLLTISYIYHNHQNVEQQHFENDVRQQISYYENIQKNQQEVYKLYHDMKNHFITLQSMQESEAAKTYVSNIMGQMKETEGQADTGLSYIDVLLNEKWKQAQEKKIDIQFSIEKSAMDFVSVFDLTVLFGNLLDNAIEAAEKVVTGVPVILVKVWKKGNGMFLTISNSYAVRPDFDGKRFLTSKADKTHHGLGLQSVQDTVKKYDGQIKTEYDEQKFQVSVCLYADRI